MNTTFATALQVPKIAATRHALPNGMTVVLAPDTAAPVVSIQAWVATGSIHEGEWLGAGLSHILEHMLFKGTPKRPVGEFAKQVQALGGRVNAYTSIDRTVYWIDAPKAGAGEAFDILSDALFNATLPEEEYVKEQEVIRREFAMGQDDTGRELSKLLLSTVFTRSPLRVPVIGYLDIYNKLTRDDVLAYYHARYVPNNITFVVSGDFDPAAMLKQIEDTLGSLPRRALPLIYTSSEPLQIGRRTDHREFPATELTHLALGWRIPGLDHPDTPALDVLSNILGVGDTSELYQRVREKDQLAHQISAGMYTLNTDGIFDIVAVCDPDKRQAAETAILAVVEAIKNKPPIAIALERAKRQLLAEYIHSLATAKGRASKLGGAWLLTRNLDFATDYSNLLDKVTASDISRVAREYLRTDRLNVISLNPPGSLAKTETAAADTAINEVQKFTLPNGLRLLVREDRRLPIVSLCAYFQGGVLAETPRNNGVSLLMSQMLLKGTSSRSALQIAETIENVGGAIDSSAGNNTFSVSLDMLSPDLTTGVEILADVLLRPIFDHKEMDKERAAQIARIKSEDEQIVSVGIKLARQKFFGDHPYGMNPAGTAESVAALTREDLLAFHRERVVAENGVIAIFGDVKAEEVHALVAKYFGRMNSGKAALAEAPIPQPLEAPVVLTETMDKNQAVVLMAFPAPALNSPDMPAVQLVNTASNDMSSRFFNRIREELGLAYFVEAMLLTGGVGGTQIFCLGTDPAKVEPVRAAFHDEITKLAQNGLNDDELARAKMKILSRDAFTKQSNSDFQMMVSLDELFGLGYDYYRNREQTFADITDTRTVAARYLDTPNFVTVIVAPPATEQKDAEGN